MSGRNVGRKPVIVWFRHDLRLDDHPALSAAVETGRPVLCVYIFDPSIEHVPVKGGAYRWWLREALASLSAQLQHYGGTLLTLAGVTEEVLPRLVSEVGAVSVFAHCRVLSGERAQDQRLARVLSRSGVGFQLEWGTVLRHPQAVLTKERHAYRVYTAFWKAFRAVGAEAPLAVPEKWASLSVPSSLMAEHRLDEGGLRPAVPDWAAGLRASWRVDGRAGLQALEAFVDDLCGDYAKARDYMAQEGTSRLSPYLASGMLSPRRLWDIVRQRGGEREGAQVFLSELGWREFAQYTLFHTPSLPYESVNQKFHAMSWRRSEHDLTAWQRGQTGVPIVDAAMRQLWQTGWMHNRARMIVGSFLAKHLLIDWREGEAWFRDTLVDYDPASNAMNWQWVAGTGIDAAPFFRIFNPTLQAEKFDPDGTYIRRWVPELGALSGKALREPWNASEAVLRSAGVELGRTYPRPIVGLSEGRDRALKAFKAL
ncbi:cryptochrome/photolyase family protein [Neokomagataea anthophila]|uniref:Deoxyribodipyrimidine photo-lyase n=1 Tax=Neokomagataea anthophila TaxID=2826925 RepID=A0ABS5E452_9PROT|nr:deoxyribodipyrimidine photo-lyase [Neokomagataea anthophila]MBR0558677.1 deoxyribodipyrimidine photo-lyase [Neokomagataea anthophila]